MPETISESNDYPSGEAYVISLANGQVTGFSIDALERACDILRGLGHDVPDAEVFQNIETSERRGLIMVDAPLTGEALAALNDEGFTATTPSIEV